MAYSTYSLWGFHIILSLERCRYRPAPFIWYANMIIRFLPEVVRCDPLDIFCTTLANNWKSLAFSVLNLLTTKIWSSLLIVCTQHFLMWHILSIISHSVRFFQLLLLKLGIASDFPAFSRIYRQHESTVSRMFPHLFPDGMDYIFTQLQFTKLGLGPTCSLYGLPWY